VLLCGLAEKLNHKGRKACQPATSGFHKGTQRTFKTASFLLKYTDEQNMFYICWWEKKAEFEFIGKK
jgi:hypothetical protein